MAGYRYQPKKYVLRFEAHEGLEVVTRGLAIGELIQVAPLADKLMGGSLDDIRDMFSYFAAHLIGWNLEHEDGTPVARTPEALLALDMDFSMMLVDAWLNAVTPGKSATSNGTAPAQMEALIPMSPVSADGT